MPFVVLVSFLLAYKEIGFDVNNTTGMEKLYLAMHKLAVYFIA
ncbi:hypothetical protein [Virgibacillus oceani]|nr:hypothetical protein [Virgibacillus oceani]